LRDAEKIASPTDCIWAYEACGAHRAQPRTRHADARRPDLEGAPAS